jgi:hypothetical protein
VPVAVTSEVATIAPVAESAIAGIEVDAGTGRKRTPIRRVRLGPGFDREGSAAARPVDCRS